MNSKLWLCRAAALPAVFLVATGASAVDLANKPLNTSNVGWNSNLIGNLQQMADDFVLGFSAIANHLTWYGYRPDRADSATFRVRLFANNGSMPESIPFYDEAIGTITGIDTGLRTPLLGVGNIREYSSAIPPVELNASTRYWLTIGSPEGAVWRWSHADAGSLGNDEYYRAGDGGIWRSLTVDYGYKADEVEQAFRLEGVPEPSTIVLTIVLLAYAVFWKPRRRKANEGLT